jgi:tetratricopeptide (TPR) repeat protein
VQPDTAASDAAALIFDAAADHFRRYYWRGFPRNDRRRFNILCEHINRHKNRGSILGIIFAMSLTAHDRAFAALLEQHVSGPNKSRIRAKMREFSRAVAIYERSLLMSPFTEENASRIVFSLVRYLFRAWSYHRTPETLQRFCDMYAARSDMSYVQPVAKSESVPDPKEECT